MLESFKIVTAKEMTRIEALAYADGASEQQFMENAGKSIAEIASDFLEDHHLGKHVTLLVGKGNNGGDAFAAGTFLLERGFQVTAWHIYPLSECSPLCKTMHDKFKKKGGKIHTVANEKSFHFEPEGVILDGLVGTGFKGKAEGILKVAIEHANAAGFPILAIDIPSGVNGSTGSVESVAIHATQTVYLEFPKLGFFENEGWDHVGELMHATFGLDVKYKDKAKPAAHLFDTDALSFLLPPLKRTRHKYQAGYVLAVAGSKQMSGAAILASFAALRSGAGIVRLFHPEDMHCDAPYEVIREEWNKDSLKRIQEESLRAKALLIGPGMGRTKEAGQIIKSVLKNCTLGCVIDADALYYLAHNPATQLPKHTILTPHHGEMHALLASFSTKDSDPIQAFVDKKNVTLVLKGAPTRIYHPHTMPLIVPHGDPGMATAGAGDVLTGVIAAMLAQGLNPRAAACVAVALHAIAGEIAAAEMTSYSMTASDIMDCLSLAFGLFATPAS